jgi:magnesium transporter
MVTIKRYASDGITSHSLDALLAMAPSSMGTSEMVWIDLADPSQDEEDAILKHWFPVHDLVLNDCRRATVLPVDGRIHHPKVEDYGTYLYVIAHAQQSIPASVTKAPSNFRPRQVNIIVAEHVLVTHHAGDLQPLHELELSCTSNPRIMRRGPDYLLHLLLDDLVDQFLPLVTSFEDRLEDMERSIFESPSTRTLVQLLDMKRNLQEARRSIVYMREMVARLSRGEFELVSDEEVVYYRNVYDHLVRVADQLEAGRESVMGMMEAYFSVSNARLNQIMKVLTVFSSIFLPLTFISSIYGMNFKYMPELDWHYGYLGVWLIIAAVATGLIVYFRRKGWLG